MKSPNSKKHLPNDHKFEDALFHSLKQNGYLFPKSLNDVVKFEEFYGDTEIEMPAHLQSYQDLISSGKNNDHLSNEKSNVVPDLINSTPVLHEEVNANLKPSRIDYYKRILLAAEIVHQLHNEATLGHLKLQKLIYLCQETSSMNLPTNFIKQAAGPYDPQMARSLDKKLLEKNWYKYEKDNFLKYTPLQNAGSHINDYNKFFIDELENISFVINTFRKAKSVKIELVATIFACWKEIIAEKMPFSVLLLSNKVYGWSEQKKKFSITRIEKAIQWMNETGIRPIS